MMRGLSTSTITAGARNTQAEAAGRRGFTPRRKGAKKGLAAGGRLRLWRRQVDLFCMGWERKWVRLVKWPGVDCWALAAVWVPWVRWVRRRNVSAGNRGLPGFNGKFRGTCPEGRGGPDWEAGRWMDSSITSGFILAWRKWVVGSAALVFNE